MNIFHSKSAVVVLLGAVLGAAGPAWSQYRATSSGRALDANLRLGSGGRNSLEGRIDYRARNDLITGNVPGGRGFRGTIDYRAPGEFGGTLGSDDLFGFRLNSIPLDPRRIDAVDSPPSIFRSYTGRAARFTGAPSSRLRVGPEGGSFRVIDPGRLIDSSQVRLEDRELLGSFTDSLGMTLGDEGKVMELTASSLFGLRQRSRSALEPPARLLVPEFKPLLPELVPSPLPEEEVAAPGLGSNARLGIERLPSVFSTELAEAETGTEEAVQIAPTLMLGSLLQARLGEIGAEAVDARTEQRIERIQAYLVNRLESATQEQGRSAYREILSALRGDEAESTEPGSEVAGRYRTLLREPTDSQLEEAEQASADALERLRSLTRPPDLVQGPEGLAARLEETELLTGGQESVDSSFAVSLAELMDKLSYDLAPLRTLNGDRETKLNRMMKQAEEQLAEGNYFTAESNYRLAVMVAPDDPMARVGLVHAQLGAGMIRSAALNLRALFEQHPELISARYGENLLPESSRLEWVQGELEQIINSGMAGGEGGLMMAYLGHQVGSRQLVRYGLAIAEARLPTDLLLGMLRHLWLDSQLDHGDGGSDSAPEPAAPAGEPTSDPTIAQ